MLVVKPLKKFGAKCTAKFGPSYFSCQKASLHFSFKLGVTITLLSPTGPQQIKASCTDLVAFTYVGTLPDFTAAIQSSFFIYSISDP